MEGDHDILCQSLTLSDRHRASCISFLSLNFITKFINIEILGTNLKPKQKWMPTVSDPICKWHVLDLDLI